jgi:hypothetical protein
MLLTLTPRKLISRETIAILLTLTSGCLAAVAQIAPPPSEKQTVLWMKLEKSILDIDRNLDGVMGVAIVDLTDGHKYLLHANDVFAQARASRRELRATGSCSLVARNS